MAAPDADPYAAVPHQQQYAEWEAYYGQQQPYQEGGYGYDGSYQQQYPASYDDGTGGTGGAYDPYGYGQIPEQGQPYDTTYGGGSHPRRDGSEQQ
ncbi:hypothetical protein GCM10020000_49430 [Streptomyces olivoverticillatus]